VKSQHKPENKKFLSSDVHQFAANLNLIQLNQEGITGSRMGILLM